MISQPGSEPSLEGVGSIKETQMKTQQAPSHKSPSLGAEQTKTGMPEYLLWFCLWQATKYQGSREIVSSLEKVGKQGSSRGKNTPLAKAGY